MRQNEKWSKEEEQSKKKEKEREKGSIITNKLYCFIFISRIFTHLLYVNETTILLLEILNSNFTGN